LTGWKNCFGTNYGAPDTMTSDAACDCLIACFQSGCLNDLYQGDHPKYEEYPDLAHLAALDHLLSPTVLSILARIQATVDHADRARARYVDDEAWEGELRRRRRAEDGE
jgi:hypothetical protein